MNGTISLESETPDMSQEARLLQVMNPLRKPAIQAAIQALHLPRGSRGSDAGCGIGLQAVQLAEAIGPSGHVTGLDLSAQLLQHTNLLAERSGVAERIAFRVGDMNELPSRCSEVRSRNKEPGRQHFLRVIR